MSSFFIEESYYLSPYLLLLSFFKHRMGGYIGGRMKTLNLVVEGMKCNGCVSKIENHFQDQSLINQVNVTLERNEVKITGDESLSNMEIKKEVEDLGFRVASIKKA